MGGFWKELSVSITVYVLAKDEFSLFNFLTTPTNTVYYPVSRQVNKHQILGGHHRRVGTFLIKVFHFKLGSATRSSIVY